MLKSILNDLFLLNEWMHCVVLCSFPGMILCRSSENNSIFHRIRSYSQLYIETWPAQFNKEVILNIIISCLSVTGNPRQFFTRSFLCQISPVTLLAMFYLLNIFCIQEHLGYRNPSVATVPLITAWSNGNSVVVSREKHVLWSSFRFYRNTAPSLFRFGKAPIALTKTL